MQVVLLIFSEIRYPNAILLSLEVGFIMANRASWGSKLGFILSVAGSAVGLANIWRFPYIVGQYGGGAFILMYLMALLLIGFPVFISEVVIGRKTQTNPSAAFAKLGGKGWGGAGKMTILTGFFVSAFYSAVAGWILGYLVEAAQGNLSSFASTESVQQHHLSLMDNPYWGVTFHFLFLLSCVGVLMLGVRNGIERCNKIMMPLLFVVLILLAIHGLMQRKASEAMTFLLTPDWKAFSMEAILVALGQAFFTLSLGQGTMVTYGSYLSRSENLLRSCIPVVIMDTVVSLLSAVAVFTIVFSAGLEPNSGPGLIFHTLPWVFSQIPLGHGVAVLFFLLVVMAALTSEISAMEPTIAYLIDEKRWKRSSAVALCGVGAFLLGIPAALSTSLLKNWTFHGMTWLDWMDYAATAILIPLGGLVAVLLVGHRWGIENALKEMGEGAGVNFKTKPWISDYFWVCIKYTAPLLIIFILINILGFI